MTVRQRITGLLALLVVLASACDDPAPTVVGRLRLTKTDAGEQPDGDEHEREPEHDEAAGERAEHDDRFERD